MQDNEVSAYESEDLTMNTYIAICLLSYQFGPLRNHLLTMMSEYKTDCCIRFLDVFLAK